MFFIGNINNNIIIGLSINIKLIIQKYEINLSYNPKIDNLIAGLLFPI